ncbi:MAG: AAA family ATPase [Crenarchaeota archaeon]|nr:AAA family ATPase [Thermoproteota archaeon]
MECGPLPKKAPSITGKSVSEIVKELWEAGVKVREDVEEVVRSFLNMVTRAEETVSMFVIGEWGEGKTSVFDGYMKALAPDEVVLLETSVKRLVSSIRSMKHSPGQSSAATFLAALLHSLAMEHLERGEELIEPYSGEPVHEYAKKALDQLMKKFEGRRIVVFIDEFEEIVSPSNKDVVKEIINGLVELINGQFGYLQERYPGRLHLVIAMTPYAYHKALSLADIDESLKGRAERRLHFKLELRPLTRSEAYRLTASFFKYAYGEEFSPVPHQFVNTLFTASQGNPGALTSLTNFVMSSLVEGGCTVPTKDPEKLVSILSRATVFTYVGSGKALDKLYYEKALLPLTYGEEDKKRVLAALAAYYYPLSEGELEELSGVEKAKEVLEVLDQRASIASEPLVARVWRTSEYQKAFKVITSSLKSLFPDIDEGTLKALIEELTYPKGLWRDEYYLVIPGEGEEAVVEEILSREKVVSDAKKLVAYLKKKLEEEGIALEEAYVLSRRHALNLYPPPAVAAASFIKDPQLRARAWKEALNALIKGEVNLDKVLAEVVVNSYKGNLLGRSVGIDLGGVQLKVAVKVLLSADMKALEEASRAAKREGSHLLLILTKPELYEWVKDKVSLLPIDAVVLEAREAKLVQMAVYELFSSKPERRALMDLEKARLTLKQIGEELGIPKALEAWIEKAKEEGIIVEDFQRPSGASEEAIAEAYSFYLAYPKDVLTTEEVFEHVIKTIRRFMIYGRGSRRRAPFASGLDIENVRGLKKYEDDLVSAGLLERLEDGRLRIALSKVESRMLKLLKERGGRSPWRELAKEFIVLSHNKRILSDFYLKILERRGLVKVERRGSEPYFVSLVNTRSLVEELESEAERLKELWSSLGPTWRSYAHIVVSKKKEDNVIMLDEVKDYVLDGVASLRSEPSKATVARRTAFLLSLSKYLKESLVPVTERAWREGSRLVEEASASVTGTISSVRKALRRVSDELGIPVLDAEEMKESVVLKKMLKKMDELADKFFTKEEIEKTVSAMRKEGVLPERFYFEKFYEPRDWRRASYFNVKYYLLEKEAEALEREVERTRRLLEEIEEMASKMMESRRRVEEKLKELSFRSYGSELASKAYEVLVRHAVLPRELLPEDVAVDSLEDLKVLLDKALSSVSMTDQRILSIVMKLGEVAREEEELERSIRKVKSWCSFIEKFYAGTPVASELLPKCERISAIEMEYESAAKEVSAGSASELGALLEELRKELRSLKAEAEAVLRELKAGHERALGELRRSAEELKRILRVASKLGVKTDDLNKTIASIELKLESVRPPGMIDATYQSLYATLERARTLLSIKLRTKLSPAEEKAIKILERGRTDLTKFVEEARKLGLSEQEAVEALVKLSEKGLAKVSVELL